MSVKRILCMLLVLVLLTAVSACGKSDPEPVPAQQSTETAAENRSPYDVGLELIALMTEKANSEEYIRMYSGLSEISGIIKSLIGDSSLTPSAAYALTINVDALKNTTDGEYDDVLQIFSFPQSIQEEVLNRLPATLISMVNARNDAMVISAASVLSTGRSFDTTQITETTVYVYVFENRCPVCVTFVPGDGHAVSANAMILYVEDPSELTAENAVLDALGIPEAFVNITELSASGSGSQIFFQ